MELSHPVHSGGFQQESPSVLFWSWAKHTKIFSVSSSFLLLPLHATCSTAFDVTVQWFTSAGPYVMVGVASTLIVSMNLYISSSFIATGFQLV